jgi:hypothetical protein
MDPSPTSLESVSFRCCHVSLVDVGRCVCVSAVVETVYVDMIASASLPPKTGDMGETWSDGGADYAES